MCTGLHPTRLDVQRGCLRGFQALNSADVSGVAPEATPDWGSKDGVFGTSRANTHRTCSGYLTKGNDYVFARLKLVVGESDVQVQCATGQVRCNRRLCVKGVTVGFVGGLINSPCGRPWPPSCNPNTCAHTLELRNMYSPNSSLDLVFIFVRGLE